MFVDKLFTISRGYVSESTVFKYEIFNILLSNEDEDIGRFSNLH